MGNSPGLDEITTTTLRNRGMKQDDAKAIKDVHVSGTHVPEKDTSSPAKQAAASGKEDAAPFPAKGPVAKANSTPVGKSSHGYGHPPSTRDGHLRCSGHSGAHRIGKKK